MIHAKCGRTVETAPQRLGIGGNSSLAAGLGERTGMLTERRLKVVLVQPD